MVRGAQRILVRVAVATAVGWTLWACGSELARCFELLPSRHPIEDPRPNRWSLRSPHVHRLEGFLAEVDRQLPPESRIAVAPRRRRGEFFVYMWHVYYLPRHEVLRATPHYAHRRADYLLTHQTRIGSRRLRELLGGPPHRVFGAPLTPLLEHPVGALYRIERP